MSTPLGQPTMLLPKYAPNVGVGENQAPKSQNKNEKLVGLEGFEPPTHGLGNHGPTVLPVRNNRFSVGYDSSHSGPRVQFVHQYAPFHAPHPATSLPSFTPIQALLPQVTLSKRRLRRLGAIHLLRTHRESRRQEIVYNARPFVLCRLPLRQPAKDNSATPGGMAISCWK